MNYSKLNFLLLCTSLTAELQRKGRREAVSQLPPRALKRLLYYNNFSRIGPDTKHSIYIRHLIGRRLRGDSDHSAKLPDRGFLGVSYYEKVVRIENNYSRSIFEWKCSETATWVSAIDVDLHLVKRIELMLILSERVGLYWWRRDTTIRRARQNIGLWRPRQSSDSGNSSGYQHTVEGI